MKIKVKLENVDGSESEEFEINVTSNDCLIGYYEGGLREREITKKILEQLMQEETYAIAIPSFITLKVLRITEEE